MTTKEGKTVSEVKATVVIDCVSHIVMYSIIE